jgi:hypothetical protein
MKLLILALVAVTSINTVSACSPAPYPYIYQSAELNYLLNSPKISTEFARLGGARISTITMKDGFYNFALTSGCFVKAKVLYKSPSNGGMCPSMTDVSLDSGCI